MTRLLTMLVALAVATSSPARADEPSPEAHVAPPALEEGSPVSVGEVVATRTRRSERHPGLLVTELEVAVRLCLGRGCSVRTVVEVPGGTLGDLEQVVAHHPVPAIGATLAVFPVRGRAKVFLLESSDKWRQLEAAARAAQLAPTLPSSSIEVAR